MANFSGKVVPVRLMLLDYLQANAGPKRIATRREIEEFLNKHGYKVQKKAFYSNRVLRVLLDGLFGFHLKYDEHKKAGIC